MTSRLLHSSIVAILITGILASPGGTSESVSPPAARIEIVYDTLNGVVIEDPYRWLEDGTSEEVTQWTAAQYEYFREYVDNYDGRNMIASRMQELMSIGSVGVPVVSGDKYFYKRRKGTQNHSILYVRDSLNGTPRVLIDPNTFSEDGTVAMDWWFPSIDGSLIAYGVSSSGSERSTLFLLRTSDSGLLPDTIPYTRSASVAWLPDNSGFYYTRFGTPGEIPEGDEDYYRRVYFHAIGDSWKDDPLVFGEELEKSVWPNPQLSPDGTKLMVTVFQGWSQTDVYFKNLSSNESEFVKLTEGLETNLRLFLLDDRFFMYANYDAPHYRLLEGRYEQPEAAHWKEVVPERESLLESFTIVDNHIVTHFLKNAYSTIEIFTLDGQPIRSLDLPGIGSTGSLQGEHDGHELFFSFSSYNMPSSIYRYDFTTDSLYLFEQVEAGVDVSNLEVKQVWYNSKDGTPVSMFVVHKHDLELNGKNSTFLSGYGGFNTKTTPYFSRTLAFWVNHGGVYATPNLRGGGEYGEEWHDAGKLDQKQNVFDDFIAAAEFLFSEGYTSPEHLLLSGGSNGGLLVGAVLTQRPDLCRAVICSVPLLDMIRYHKFLIARLWIPEYGSSENPDQFKFLYAYSPYHHVTNGTKYPTVLFKASASDGRVDPLHARKMTALMQAATGSENPILLRIESKAGHGVGKPVSKRIEDLTDTWTFVFKTLGVEM